MNVKKDLRKKIRHLLFFLSVYYVSGLMGPYRYCMASSSGHAVTPEKYNIILIVFDSIRADHLSCYGYARKTSSVVDNVAGSGILFEQAIAHSTWSLPSQCSILTSKYVSSHGVDSINKRLSDSEITLAEVLKMYGYQTAAFTGGFWVSSVFNSGQGFDVYFDNLTFGKIHETIPHALEWLKDNKDKRFFLLLQGFDGHSPFNLPKEYEKKYVDPSYNGVFKTVTLDHTIGDRLGKDEFFLDYSYQKKVKVTPEDIGYIIDNYDGSIAYADTCVGDFLKKIEEWGLKDNTVIILTSYHGTPLFEHGIILRRQHGGVTEGTIRVPLIISHPQLRGGAKKIPTQVQQIDIMPTILDFVGIPVNHQAQGRSLVPLIEAKAGPHFDEYAYVNGYKELAVRTDTWKLIKRCVSPKEEGFELYNLHSDPGEKNNVINREVKIAENMKIKLNEWSKRTEMLTEKTNLVSKQEIDKIKQEMKKAGYWFIQDDEKKEVLGRDAPEALAAGSECFAEKAAHNTPEAEVKRPVKIGYFHGGRVHGLYRAYVYNYFEEEHVPVELYSQYLNEDRFLLVPREHRDMKEDSEKGFGKLTGTKIIKAIENGTLDGGTPGESSFVEAVNKGSPIVAVALLGHDVKDKPGKAFLLRKDVIIKSPDDFRGKKFGTRRAGPGDKIFLSEFFRSIGLDSDKDITIVDQISDDQLTTLIKEKKIDGALYHLHAGISEIESGLVYLYRPMDWIDPEISHALLVFRKDFIKKHPQEVKSVIRAYMKRIKYEHSLPEEKKLESQDFGLQMLLYYKGMSLPQYNYPPLVNVDLLRQMQVLLFDYKIINKKSNLKKFIDNRFVQEIYEELK